MAQQHDVRVLERKRRGTVVGTMDARGRPIPLAANEDYFLFDRDTSPLLTDLMLKQPVIGGETKAINLQHTNEAASIYGGMTTVAELIVPIATANPTEIKNSSDRGWIGDDDLKSFTFSNHFITATLPGYYAVIWSASVHTASGGKTEVHVGISINSTAQRNNGEGHRTVANTNDTGAVCANGRFNLVAGDQLSLWAINDLGNDLHFLHLSMFAKRVLGV